MTSEADLFKVLGKENVKRTSVELGEGATRPGTVVFPGTADEISILWKDDGYRFPEVVTIAVSGTKWTTSRKITIGTPLNELIKINNKHFKLYGYAWDGAGYVTSWDGGELEKDHKIGKAFRLQLGITREVSWEELGQVTGQREFSSDNRLFAEMGLRVITIKIMFP